MERLEQALKQALSRNADETKRWNTYKEEQEIAISNMQKFGEALSVEVMVPVGSKAFMPGKLQHTNEIMVSHFQGIFSKCTSQQAQKFANHRLNIAKQRLESLEKEREMYQNKLDKPYMDGALPSGEEQEIIEEFNEEEEKLWRIEHQKRVREEKLKESEQLKEAVDNTPTEDVMKLLDDLEIMEELEEELDKLHIEDDDTLQKLMAGEIPLPPEKKRIARSTDSKDIVIGGNGANAGSDATKNRSVVDEIAEKLHSFNANEAQESIDYTNNNSLPNTADYDSEDDTESSTTEDIPQRVLQIESEAEHLPVPAKIKYFKSKLKEIDKEIKDIVMITIEDLDRKMSLMEVREYLVDYIEMLKDELNEGKTANNVSVNDNKIIEESKPPKKKKSISFAKEDEVNYIYKDEAPSDGGRSKIELDDESFFALKLKPPNSQDSPVMHVMDRQLNLKESSTVDKKIDILEKVQKSIEFVAENQSHRDFNIVDKIIESVESVSRTLHIEVTHSDNDFIYPGYTIEEDCDDNIIGSPADIYERFRYCFPQNAQDQWPPKTISTEVSKNEHKSIHPQGDEGDSLEMQTTEVQSSNKQEPTDLSLSLSEQISSEKLPTPNNSIKSILKNKEKVHLETINAAEKPNRSEKSKSKKKQKTRDTDDAWVMGEVVEKEVTKPVMSNEINTSKTKEQVDPLPNENFVDVLAPKKRISRFKQMRENS